MTNPLSNLNRYPRRPFKEKNFNKINEKLVKISGNLDTSLCRDTDSPIREDYLNDLLEDVATDMAVKNISKYSKEMLKYNLLQTTDSYSPRSVDKTNCKPLSQDFELISKLMERIKQLELSQRYQEKEIKDKNLRIKVLEDKCKLYLRSKDIFENQSDKVIQLEKECEKLQSQISEMESFLADYGLVWIGDNSILDNKNSIDNSLWKNDNLSKDQDIPVDKFVVNYDKILMNINELNLLINSEESLITLTGPERVELKKKQSIQLTLYANGISLFSGPFRPFSDKSTREVIQDIIDGYFPSELEDRYPSGVPFHVMDRRNIFFDAKQTNAFQGTGKTLGGLSISSKLLNNSQQNGDKDQFTQPFTEILSRDISTQITVEQFLNKLPSSTINSNGRIMSIRNSIREIIENKPTTNNKSSSTLVTNDHNETNPKTFQNEYIFQKLENAAQIKIRSLNNENIYHINMNLDETIHDLYEKLSNICNISNDTFVLVSAIPPCRQLVDMNITIEHCGLVPNASLYMQLL